MSYADPALRPLLDLEGLQGLVRRVGPRATRRWRAPSTRFGFYDASGTCHRPRLSTLRTWGSTAAATC